MVATGGLHLDARTYSRDAMEARKPMPFKRMRQMADAANVIMRGFCIANNKTT